MKRYLSLLLCVLLLGSLSACGGEEESVAVQAVSMVAGGGSALVERCAGKVVSGETAKLQKDADKTVLEVLVKEGDMVKEGDVLFAYDMEAMQLSLDKMYLDRESYDNTIAAANTAQHAMVIQWTAPLRFSIRPSSQRRMGMAMKHRQ